MLWCDVYVAGHGVLIAQWLALDRLWCSRAQAVLPNLQCLALDPVHLAIVYEYTSWHKRTGCEFHMCAVCADFGDLEWKA
jgi:hypothetical protein